MGHSNAAVQAASRGTVETAGSEGAPALVLVHGVTVNRMVWRPHMALLAQRHRVFALDLPGHGSLAGMPYSLDGSTELLRATVSRIPGGRALIVGDSLGGYSALAFAACYPELISGLVLASCTLPIRGPLAAAARLGAVLASAALSTSGGRGALNQVAEARTRGAASEEYADPVLSAGVRLEALPEAYVALAGQDFPRMLRGLSLPVLILNGERDVPFRVWERAYLGCAPNARLHVLRGARHTASRDLPGPFSAAVLSFAASIGW